MMVSSSGITEAALGLDHARTAVDTRAAGDLPAPVVTAVALAPPFLAAEVAPELAPRTFIGIDALVNPLVADPEARDGPEPTADLCQAPVLPRAALQLAPRCAARGAA